MNLSTTLLASAAALFITAGTASAATVVATADLHMRSGPGTEYPVIAVIPQGVAVHSGNCGAGWCRVDYRGRSGWASRAYLGGGASTNVYSYEYTAPSYGYYGYSEPEYYGYYGYSEPGYYGYYSPFVVGFGGTHRDHFGGGFGHHRFADRGISPHSGGFALRHGGFGGHGFAQTGGGHFRGGAHMGGFGGQGFAHMGGGHFGGGAHRHG
jgi:uncharacterized protein YraI